MDLQASINTSMYVWTFISWPIPILSHKDVSLKQNQSVREYKIANFNNSPTCTDERKLRQ